jgi:flagellar protein FliO/FliZ
MKPLILFRGAALSGAVSLARAGVAVADRASRGRTVHASATTTSPLPALNYGQNTPLHLSGGGISHAASDASATGSIVRTIVGLAIVIAVIYGLSWIIRQARKAKNPALGTGLEQIASLPLGTGRSVSLVRVGSELHLLGIAEHGVSRIRTFTEDEAIAAGLPISTRDEYEDNPPPITKAIDLLRRMTVR